MKWVPLACLSLLVLVGCGRGEIWASSGSLVEARKEFRIKIRPQQRWDKPVPQADARIARIVKYDSPVGQLGAYITPDPGDGKKHPAIIWIHSGDCSSIDEDVVEEGVPDFDLSASAYRKVGIVMMYPSLRGGNDNPGKKEGFFGEVDDLIAAREFLAKQDYVDPKRIYLGGLDEGGTLVMLVAEYSDQFRGIFSFNPMGWPNAYDEEDVPFDRSDWKEVQLRSPIYWLHSIQSPTYAFAGTSGLLESLQEMRRNSTSPKAHFYSVRGGGYFDILDPINRLIAQKILLDTTETSNIAFTEDEVNQAMRK